MIWVHVLNQLSEEQLEHHTFFGKLIGFLGSTPAAPVFMTLMGASFVLAPPASLSSGIARGLRLLLMGYLLNLARFVTPLYLAKALSMPIPAALPNVLDALLIIDILQFAGLAYILLTLLHALRLPALVVGGLAVGGSLFSFPLWGLGGDLPFWGRVLDLLWGNRGEWVAFPLFPWLAFPLSGYAVTQFLTLDTSMNTKFQQVGMLGLALLGLGSLWISFNPDFHLGDYWRMGPGGMVASIGFVWAWLWAWFALVPDTTHNALTRLLTFGSRNVTTIYLIQWILIGWATLLVGYEQAGLGLTLLLMLLMTGLSYGLARIGGSDSTRKKG